MGMNLDERKDCVVQSFLEKGLQPAEIFELIQYLGRSVFFNPNLSAFEIKEEFYNSRLPLVNLEEDLLQQVKQCLILEGRKGLEFRFGEGFSFLNENQPYLS